MLIANKYEFPDKCPNDCPHKGEALMQGGYCHRCPIFNCRPFIGPDGDEISLLRPEDYREDWAKVWYEWFKSGYKTKLELYL